MSEKGKKKKRKTQVLKPRLDVFWSANNRFFFVRMDEEDKSSDRLVTLYRLLEASNIDTEKAMSSWSRLRAMKLPAHIASQLRHYYEFRELDLSDWLVEV